MFVLSRAQVPYSVLGSEIVPDQLTDNHMGGVWCHFPQLSSSSIANSVPQDMLQS